LFLFYPLDYTQFRVLLVNSVKNCNTGDIKAKCRGI